MISLRLKSSISIALICFVVGCCTAFLLMANCGSPAKQPAMSSATLLKAQADSLHAHYQVTITDLEKRNKQLDTELQNTKVELKAAKAKAITKANEIKKIIYPPGYPAKELLKKSISLNPVIDSSLQKCDSLALLVSEYLQESEQKDRLYETQINWQDSLLSGKDEIIVLRQSENLNLSVLFKQSLAAQQYLETNNLKLRKKMKRQRSAGKWLALGSAVLSGLTTHYLSNR